MTINFPEAFRALTGGKSPFKWQERLFAEIARGDIPDACDIPTGLGKTSIIPIWLIALAQQALAWQENGSQVWLPRRLVYVVNRRTVVDQATSDAERIRASLKGATSGAAAVVARALEFICVDPRDAASPLAISTLRGEFADNREWQADPARAAIIVGTVDMIGSRLLFSSYGVGGSYRRAQSAGLLGHDALLVHDEAHLSKPFGALIKEIARIQEASDRGTAIDGTRALRVMELSATLQDADGQKKTFELSQQDRSEKVVQQRLLAKKALRITSTESEIASLVNAALVHSEKKVRVVIYVRRPEIAKDVAKALSDELDKAQPKSAASRIAILTGTLRGKERDDLATSALFQAFRANPKREELPETIYLVATSAGEVGVDLDADHMVCDLTTLDSMIQRLGRVNRLGRNDETFIAQIAVFDAPVGKAKDGDAGRASKIEHARRATAVQLQRLPLLDSDDRHDASPLALRTLVDSMSLDERAAAFSPEPLIMPVRDILLDNWALTSIRELPNRPRVGNWLHGKDSDPPETIVVWREEVGEIAAALDENRLSQKDAMKWFDAHRILPQERLRTTTQRAGKAFDAIAARAKKGGQSFGAIVLKHGKAAAIPIELLSDKETFDGAIVVLPVRSGGLKDGMLDGTQPTASDVADDPRKRDKPKGPGSPRWRARISKTDGIWSVEAIGDVDKHIVERLALFNDRLLKEGTATQRSIEKVIQGIATSIKEKGRSETWFVEADRVTITPEDEPDAIFRVLVSFAPAKSAETAFDKSEAAPSAQALQPHLDAADRFARCIGKTLGLPEEIATALAIAAGGHDWGKHRRPWQRAIGNVRYPHMVLAKSGHRRFNSELCKNYRHEFGSLIEARRDEKIRKSPDWQYELILYLIASHHGWARPHFKPDLDDPNANGDEIATALALTPRFYARMQRRFGRWGLAWLEALMKAADVMATTSIEPEDGMAAALNGVAPSIAQEAPA